MKIKIFGFALLLGLATVLGACENADQPATTPDAPIGEPNDAPVVPDATPIPTTTP